MKKNTQSLVMREKLSCKLKSPGFMFPSIGNMIKQLDIYPNHREIVDHIKNCSSCTFQDAILEYLDVPEYEIDSIYGLKLYYKNNYQRISLLNRCLALGAAELIRLYLSLAKNKKEPFNENILLSYLLTLESIEPFIKSEHNFSIEQVKLFLAYSEQNRTKLKKSYIATPENRRLVYISFMMCITSKATSFMLGSMSLDPSSYICTTILHMCFKMNKPILYMSEEEIINYRKILKIEYA